MANVIARAQGYTKDGSAKAGEATRLGGGSVRVEGNTWRTFVKTDMHADGHFIVTITRDGKLLAQVYGNAETETAPCVELHDYSRQSR
jgi:hypothetical protein